MKKKPKKGEVDYKEIEAQLKKSCSLSAETAELQQSIPFVTMFL
jgi:hypothetical protein